MRASDSCPKNCLPMGTDTYLQVFFNLVFLLSRISFTTPPYIERKLSAPLTVNIHFYLVVSEVGCVVRELPVCQHFGFKRSGFKSVPEGFFTV